LDPRTNRNRVGLVAALAMSSPHDQDLIKIVVGFLGNEPFSDTAGAAPATWADADRRYSGGAIGTSNAIRSRPRGASPVVPQRWFVDCEQHTPTAVFQ